MIKKYYIYIIVLIFNLFLIHCNNPTKSEAMYYKVKVDSIKIIQNSELGDTVLLRFYGFVGQNYCYQFSHFEVAKKDQKIDFSIWGYYSGEEICAEAIRKLKGKKYKLIPAKKGKLNINIIQPDNTVLKYSTYIN